jgi:hypothetical protein
MTRSWSAGRRSEWSSIEKTAWSRCQRSSNSPCCSRIRAYLGLYGDVQRGCRGLSTDGGWAKRARQVEERVSLGHGEAAAIRAIAEFRVGS